MKKYEILDISGDIGIRSFGKSVREAFINIALGMYSLITDLNTVEEKKTIDISIESHSQEGTLVSWLNELIFYFDAYGFIGKKIDIKQFSENKIVSIISGGKFEPERHEGKLLIKAATYHNIRIERVDDVWEIDVIFDI
jgi:SHS2 domain-containing protein